MLIRDSSHDAFNTPQWAPLHANLLAHDYGGPRQSGKPGVHDRLNGHNFSFVDRLRSLSFTHEVKEARSRQKREALIQIQTAKEIAREKRQVHDFYPVRPAALAAVDGQKLVEAFTSQNRRDGLFVV